MKFASHIKQLMRKVDAGGKITEDPHQQTIMNIACKYDRGEMEEQLGDAIDSEDEERMNLLLDAIQLEHQYNELIMAIPSKQRQELINYAKERIRQGK